MLKDGSDAGTDDELLNADDREITECLDDADSRLAGEISTSVGADTLRRATDTLYEMDNARFQGDTVDDILAEAALNLSVGCGNMTIDNTAAIETRLKAARTRADVY